MVTRDGFLVTSGHVVKEVCGNVFTLFMVSVHSTHLLDIIESETKVLTRTESDRERTSPPTLQPSMNTVWRPAQR